jgi:DNA repair protein RadC
MRIHTVSIGILDSSLVHPREVFKDAILASSASIIVAHNHPSGDPTPSVEDKRVTQRLYEAGQILGIDLLDHIVIGDNKWVSLKQLGAF